MTFTAKELREIEKRTPAQREILDKYWAGLSVAERQLYLQDKQELFRRAEKKANILFALAVLVLFVAPIVLTIIKLIKG